MRLFKTRIFRKKRSFAWIVLWMMAISVFVDKFFPPVEENYSARLIPHLLFILILLSLVVYLFHKGIEYEIYSSKLFVSALLWGFVVLLSFLRKSSFTMGDFVMLSKYLYWLIGVLGFYRMALYGEITTSQIRMISIMVALVGILRSFMGTIWGMSLDRGGEFSGLGLYGDVGNYSYTLLWFIPLLLLSKRTSWKETIFVLAICAAIMASLKRGASLAMLTSLLVYYMVDLRIGYKIKRTYLLIVLVALMLVAVVLFVGQERVAERWSDISDLEQMGSGRGIIWGIIVTDFKEAGLVRQIFGTGFNSVPHLIERKWYKTFPAHSDWLQCLYDQGIVGIVSLLYFYYAVFELIKNGYRTKHFLTAPLSMGFSIFAVSCIFSITTFNVTTIWFGLLMGYCSGMIQKDHRLAFTSAGLEQFRASTTYHPTGTNYL